MNGSLLSIVIVNWNTRELLKRCLASVQENAAALEQSSIETFVVDNASDDGSVRMVRTYFPWVQVIANEENVGFARANNQAIRVSTGQYVLLLNSDTEVLTGALEIILRFTESHPQVGAVGPRLLNGDGSLQVSCQPMLTPMREFLRLSYLDPVLRRASYDVNKWRVDSAHRVDVLKGACLLLKRAALEQVGYLDESYYMYTEEVDLCYRLAQAGWELWWLPKASVIHYGEASSRQVAEEMYLQLYRSKIQFYRKFGGEQRAKMFKTLLRFAYWPRILVATMGSPFAPDLGRRSRLYRRLLGELPSM